MTNYYIFIYKCSIPIQVPYIQHFFLLLIYIKGNFVSVDKNVALSESHSIFNTVIVIGSIDPNTHVRFRDTESFFDVLPFAKWAFGRTSPDNQSRETPWFEIIECGVADVFTFDVMFRNVYELNWCLFRNVNESNWCPPCHPLIFLGNDCVCFRRAYD